MILNAPQRAALEAELPPRLITRKVYRQTDPLRQPLDLPPMARRDARWHRKGGPWPAYAADSELAAMLQLPRYFEAVAAEHPLPQRRMSELHLADFPVLDLVNALALDTLELTPDDLTAGLNGDPDAEICREISDIALARNDLLGLLVPSAARRGATDLVIFARGFAHVTVGNQAIVQLRVARVPRSP